MNGSGNLMKEPGPMGEPGVIGAPVHRINAGYKGGYVLRYQDQRGDGIERGI